MITVNLDELLNQIKSTDTKEYLSIHNFAVLENLNPIVQEDSQKKAYLENVKKITSFVASENKDKAELKKFQNQVASVLQSSYFNFADIGKKVIKNLVQNKILDLLANLIEKHLTSIDDESLCVVLNEVLQLEDETQAKETGTPFKQIKEKLLQDNLKFRVFSEALSDIFNLSEDIPSTFQRFFVIYIVALICQRSMDKITFMKSVLKLKTKKVQFLLEVLYILAVPLSPEYSRLSLSIHERTVFEYISNTINASFERIKDENSIKRLFELLSKALKKKSDEIEALSLLNNLNTLSSTQYMNLENIDLRKNLNIEEFRF